MPQTARLAFLGVLLVLVLLAAGCATDSAARSSGSSSGHSCPSCGGS